MCLNKLLNAFLKEDPLLSPSPLTLGSLLGCRVTSGGLNVQGSDRCGVFLQMLQSLLGLFRVNVIFLHPGAEAAIELCTPLRAALLVA